MKTLTEFTAPQIKNGHAKLQELATAGKTVEELSAGVGEAFKFEGDKIKWFLWAIEAATPKLTGLKRLLVLKLDEKDKAPTGAIQKEEWHLVMEYYAQPQAPARQDRDDRGGRGGRDGKRGGKGGRDGKRGGPGGDRGGRGPGGDRGPRRDGPAPLAADGSVPVVIVGERPAGGDRRPPREPRAPREPRPAPAPWTGPKGIIPKGPKPATAPVAAAPAADAPKESTES